MLFISLDVPRAPAKRTIPSWRQPPVPFERAREVRLIREPGLQRHATQRLLSRAEPLGSPLEPQPPHVLAGRCAVAVTENAREVRGVDAGLGRKVIDTHRLAETVVDERRDPFEPRRRVSGANASLFQPSGAREHLEGECLTLERCEIIGPAQFAGHPPTQSRDRGGVEMADAIEQVRTGPRELRGRIGLHDENVRAAAADRVGVHLARGLGEHRAGQTGKPLAADQQVERTGQHHGECDALVCVPLESLARRKPCVDQVPRPELVLACIPSAHRDRDVSFIVRDVVPRGP